MALNEEASGHSDSVTVGTGDFDVKEVTDISSLCTRSGRVCGAGSAASKVQRLHILFYLA